jgi:hypothetical protein
MRSIKILIISLAITLVGCASGVKQKDMVASIPTLKADQGRIYFFRSASMLGAAIQPNIKLDGVVVGESVPGGFFYVDSNSGNHEVSTATEVENKLTFTLDKGEVKYVQTKISFGFMVGHVAPELVSEADANKELPDLSYTGISTGGVIQPAPSSTSQKAPIVKTDQVSPADAVISNGSASESPLILNSQKDQNPQIDQTNSLQMVTYNANIKSGVSAFSVEKLAKQQACLTSSGAELISNSGTKIEDYRVSCNDGRQLTAHCEYRQCAITSQTSP